MERLLELLSYAQVCFGNCTSPFELIHLIKKDIKANECIDLSHQIASIIDEWIGEVYNRKKQKDSLEKAKKDFDETQGE